MEYSVPTARDLADVRSLNLAVLRALRQPHGEDLRRSLPASCRPQLAALTDPQIERLAEAPFLLLSLHEQDDAYWQRLLEADPHRDLFAVNDRPADDRGRIVAAALGFAWQLARRDAYAARLLCGASSCWCRRLAARPLLEVLARTAESRDLLVLRHADSEHFWSRLLGAGLSQDRSVRAAAQLAALQVILTGCDNREHPRLASAARRAAVPTIRT